MSDQPTAFPIGSVPSLLGDFFEKPELAAQFAEHLYAKRSGPGWRSKRGFRDWAGAKMTTLAIVFTDVVGSTSLACQVGDEEMETIRLAHFKRARSVLGKFSGYEIKTIGDSFMIAFRTAVDAFDFCLEINRNAGHQSVRLRAGIDVGLVHVREEDAFGTTVRYASRIESKASAGEICASDRAYNDIKNENAKCHRGLSWIKRTCQLKGFKGRHRVWLVKPNRRPASI